jgi:hypothetical protein
MKPSSTLSIALLLINFSVFAQVTDPQAVSLEPITSIEELQKRGIKEEEINKAIEASKKDILGIVGEKEFPKYKLLGVDIDEAKLSFMVPYRCETGNENNAISSAAKNTDDILKSLQTEKGNGNGGMIYVTWGYNRSWFKDADTTFKTPNGTFIIHKAHAEDRPSKELKTYVTSFTIPQFNVRVGYKFNEKWSVEVGHDHMKWIFSPDQETKLGNHDYKITGNYDKPVWIHDGKWTNYRQVSFEEAKAQKNASFVMMEHSDGYNYPHATAFFTDTLLKSKNEMFRMDGSLGAGAGLLVPKTRMRIADTEDGSYRDIDNKYHIAGWGAHVEANAKFVYAAKSGKEVFLQASNRGHVGKINNALFLGSEGSISQAPIYTYEVYVSVGVSTPLDRKKNKKK